MGTDQPDKKWYWSALRPSMHPKTRQPRPWPCLKIMGQGTTLKLRKAGEAPSLAFTPSDPAQSWEAHLAAENP